MSSYNRTVWQDSPETEITAEHLNNQELGIEQAHNGDNIPNFTSSDELNTEEKPLEWTDVELLEKGNSMSLILSKISSMFKNIRYLFKNMVTAKQVSSASVQTDAKLHVRVGTKVILDYTNDYAVLFTKNEVAELLGINEDEIEPTKIFIYGYNGDGNANTNHITSIDWYGGIYNRWYIYCKENLSEIIRVNYIIVYAET